MQDRLSTSCSGEHQAGCLWGVYLPAAPGPLLAAPALRQQHLLPWPRKGAQSLLAHLVGPTSQPQLNMAPCHHLASADMMKAWLPQATTQPYQCYIMHIIMRGRHHW